MSNYIDYIRQEKKVNSTTGSTRFLLYLTFLQVPKRINWEEYIPQSSDQWESQMDVTKLFDEKPIWPKDSLTERLLDKGYNFAGHMLRRYSPWNLLPVIRYFVLVVNSFSFCRLLSRVAYYFSSGPFLRFWIRKGYDPRKDPQSRM